MAEDQALRSEAGEGRDGEGRHLAKVVYQLDFQERPSKTRACAGLNANEASTGYDLLNLVTATVQDELEAVVDGGPTE
ncbi:MAG: hypothetical protein KBA60_06075 [Flavobacteriales bacterium]|nr:hypothetical protein [Flavobacteriales bacterium]HQV74443.1 hypothetical protein [Flavobacteriales bacterium]HQW40267.1 hypothetical protein [Flavobacteriales bacterium]